MTAPSRPAGTPDASSANGKNGQRGRNGNEAPKGGLRWGLMGVGAIAAAVVLVVFPWLGFASDLLAKLSGSSEEVNIATDLLVAVVCLFVAFYLARQAVKFLRASRDPFAKSELEAEMKPRAREFRHSLHLIRKSLLAMVGLAIIVIYVGMAIFGPYLAPVPYEYSPYEKHVTPGSAALAPIVAPASNLSSTTFANLTAMAALDGSYSDSANVSDVAYLSNVSIDPIFPQVSNLEVGVDYYSPNANTLAIALSWDNGTSWTADQVLPFRTNDTNTLWYLSFASDRTWSVTDLDVSHFVVRLTHVLGTATTAGQLRVNQVVVRETFIGPIHPWGTNLYGEDVMAGILEGAATDLRIGLLVVAASVGVGILLGVTAGYFGGTIDEFVMRITDMVLAIPGLILALAVTAMLGRSLENVLLALVLVSWPSYTRLVRGMTLSVREVSYVEAARSVGAKPRRIMFRHVLPNAMSPVIVAATLDMGTIVLSTAALSFIGVGARTTDAEWGVMIQIGYSFMTSGYWWEYVIPGLAIFFFVMAFNLFGDGLRDILDPRLRR